MSICSKNNYKATFVFSPHVWSNDKKDFSSSMFVFGAMAGSIFKRVNYQK